jgi:hypothetical protein
VYTSDDQLPLGAPIVDALLRASLEFVKVRARQVEEPPEKPSPCAVAFADDLSQLHPRFKHETFKEHGSEGLIPLTASAMSRCVVQTLALPLRAS